MASDQTSYSRQALELLLTTAHTFLGRAEAVTAQGSNMAKAALNDATEAQSLYVKVKIAATGQQGLEHLIDAANRCFPITHLVQARASYNIGVTNFDPQTGILGDGARTELQTAADKYSQADNAFREFEGSFKLPEELSAKQQWLAQLYLYWVDTCFKLAVDAHSLGNQQISAAAENAQDKKRILDGLGQWDRALTFYRLTAEIQIKAQTQGAQVDLNYRTLPEQRIREISAAAVGWANAIGKPELAEKYLLTQS